MILDVPKRRGGSQEFRRVVIVPRKIISEERGNYCPRNLARPGMGHSEDSQNPEKSGPGGRKPGSVGAVRKEGRVSGKFVSGEKWLRKRQQSQD